MHPIVPYKQGADLSITLVPEKSESELSEKQYDLDATVEWNDPAEGSKISKLVPEQLQVITARVEVSPGFSPLRATAGAREENSKYLDSSLSPIDPVESGLAEWSKECERYINPWTCDSESSDGETLSKVHQSCEIETCIGAGKKSLNDAARKGSGQGGSLARCKRSKIAPQSPEARKKRRLPRSKTGCWTCRCRRKKCDETRPKCRTCAELGIDCSGYGIDRPIFMTDREAGKRYRAHISRTIQNYKMTSKA